MCFGRSIGHFSPRLAGIVNPPPTIFSPHQPHVLLIQLLAIDPYRTMASSLWPAPNIPHLRLPFLRCMGTWITGHLSLCLRGVLWSPGFPYPPAVTSLEVPASYRLLISDPWPLLFYMLVSFIGFFYLYAFDSGTENLTAISRLSSEPLYMYSCSSESTSQRKKIYCLSTRSSITICKFLSRIEADGQVTRYRVNMIQPAQPFVR